MIITASESAYIHAYFFVDGGDRIKKVGEVKLMAHEYSFLAGFLQEVDGGESTERSSQGRTFKHESGGSGSMPRPRLLRLTSCTPCHPPAPCGHLPFLLLFHPLPYLHAPWKIRPGHAAVSGDEKLHDARISPVSPGYRSLSPRV